MREQKILPAVRKKVLTSDYFHISPCPTGSKVEVTAMTLEDVIRKP